ncbi:MAG: MobB mobilization protein [Myxococcales bacterium]|nr:MobB mobilization protein [Myxococcales bacterium]MDD9965626.1 MobB mobilization protein [Myxococcales bacterium]
MPFQQQGDEPMDQVTHIRMTAEEKASLRSEANEAGITISEYGRRRLFGRKVVAQADQAVLNELRRLGGLVKHVHNQGGDSRETVETLRSLRAAIDRLGRDG